jgi:hypothetical protein
MRFVGTQARRWAPWALFVVPAVLLLWSVRAVVDTYSPTPFSDQWANVWWWRELSQGRPLADYLFSQHNEHRLFFPRLVFLADFKWFQGRNILNLVAIGVIQLAGAAFYIKVARVRQLRWLGVLGLSVAVSLMFLLLQWENFFWGFQVQFVGVFVAGAWALYLFLLASADPSRVRWGPLAGALALLTIATFSMANGFFAGAVMVLVGLLTRRNLAATGIALVATVLLAALFLRDYHIVREHTSNAMLLRHPGRYLHYVLAYLGNVWARAQPWRGELAGALGVLATLAMTVVVLRDRERDLPRTALFAVALFIGVTAVVTGAGRLGLGEGQAFSSRYVTPACHFWAAQALFWTLTAQSAPSRGLKLAVAGVLLVAYLAMLPLQRVGHNELLATREPIVQGSSALLSGVEDQEALANLYPELGKVHDLKPFLRENKLATFADDPGYRVGSRFEAPIVPVGEDTCRGYIDAVKRSPTHPDFAKAVGWGWDLKARRPFHLLVITDDSRRVLGLGLSGLPRPDVRKVVRQVRALGSGWAASVARPAAGEIAVYGLLRDGRACELGRQAWPQ